MSSVNENSGISVNVNTAAEYNATLPTYSDGDSTALQADSRGRLLVVDQNSAAALAALSAIQTAVADLDGNTDGIEAALASILTAVTDLDPNTDGLEALLTTISNAVADLDPNTDGIEALLTAIDAKLDTIDSVDFATQTTLNSLLTAFNAEDFATQTTLAAMSAKLPAALGQTVMASALSVALASDQTAIPVTQSGSWTITPATLSIIDQIDTGVGPVLDAASNNIQDNAGAFLAVVASLAAQCKKVHCTNTTGYFIGVYTGPAASEVLAFIISPGTDNIYEHTIAAATRISLRNMATNDVTEGNLMMQFLG